MPVRRPVRMNADIEDSLLPREDEFFAAKFGMDGEVKWAWSYTAWTLDQTKDWKPSGTKRAAEYGDQPHADKPDG